MKRNTERYLCGLNIKALGDAAILYAQANDDRLPPVSDNDGAPSFRDGQLHCWATIPSIRGSIDPHRDLDCPSATDEESVPVAASGHSTERLSYGMYMALGSAPLSSIENPSTALMLGETSNFGAHESYDPTPFRDAAGNPIKADGYAIGWNTDNFFPSEKTRSVTRLAFYDVKNGEFGDNTQSRHPGGIYFITAEGGRVLLEPAKAFVSMGPGGRPRAPWGVPYTYTPPGH
jgi:hypothetical protein